MAIVDVPGMMVYPRHFLTASSNPGFTTTTLLLDAGDEAVGCVLPAPKTGNISKVGWATRLVTTGATLDIRIETVSAGFPSGTLWSANTNGAQVVADTDDNTGFVTALTSVAAVTLGQLIAIRIVNPSVSPGNMQIAAFADDINAQFPVLGLYTASSWAGVSQASVVYLEYDDGSYAYIPAAWPLNTAIVSNSISTSTTPDVAGVRFKLSFPARIKGVWLYCDFDGDANVRLVTAAYHQVNQTGVLGSIAVAENERGGSTLPATQFRIFPSAIDLAADTYYRLVVEPSSTTAVTVFDFDIISLAAMSAYAGPDFHFTTAKDPTGDGDWTNYNSGTFRVPFMGLLIGGFDAGGGAGGGMLIHPGMSGGLRG